MLLRRIRCHFCGSRQPHSKTVVKFQCTNCEAFNFLDGKGNIVDTPVTFAGQSTTSETRSLSFTRPRPDSTQHQKSQAFCRTCTQNQLLYNETLANYLPDESHPSYRKFEAALPAYKKELEKRYPLVCKTCAPMAQTKISQADHYGMTQNVRKLQSATRARGGMPATHIRDDWKKQSMRLILSAVASVLYAGLAVQLVYHTYGIVNILFGASPSPELSLEDDIVPSSNPKLVQCATQSLALGFDSACLKVLSTHVPFTLALAACFLWYNPGIKAWFHHTNRIEQVNGQRNYFYMQVIILVVRSWAWYNLSNPHTIATLNKEQLIGYHSFVIIFTCVTQFVAHRGVRPVIWTIRGKIMPKPSEEDVLGGIAGPSTEHYTPKASKHDPWKYLRRPENSPLDIGLLAAKGRKEPWATKTSHFAQQPSPEISEDEVDYDAMEMDDRPVMRSSQTFSRPNLIPRAANHDNVPGIGFGSMTDQVFDMQTGLRRQEEERQMKQEQKLRFQPPTHERNPFYGRLPPAPMSMERRLRNPVITPIEPQRLPLSMQKDFMSQMRAGVKPAQFPEKGTNFELRKSEWHLPSDVKETGLEDRFLTTFNLADPAPPVQEDKRGFLGFFSR